jgi:ABC-2 type transport system ATP-binding protein
MIQLTDVTKSYGGSKAVDGVTVSIPSGQILGFLGPNGAGKTTTMRMITCYMPPTSGSITVDGLDVGEQSVEVRKKIGYLPELAPVYHDMNVVDYLRYAADLRHIEKDRRSKRIKEVVDRCGLTTVLGKDIGQLSKGYRQRVGLAQAIIHNPEILVLDEPTAGLDPNQIVEIRMLIKELGREKTVILSTHILSEVQATCSRIIIINGGKVVADNTPELLQAEAAGRGVLIAAVRTAAGDVVAKTRQMSGVEDVRVIPSQSGTTKVRIETAATVDVREPFFHLAVKENWVIFELSQETKSLEDVFHKLTTDKK